MNKTLDQFTDLELVKAQGQVYQQIMQNQANLQAINLEVDRREKLVNVNKTVANVNPNVNEPKEEDGKKS